MIIGLVIGLAIIVIVTYLSNDRPQTFVEALGAVGQVGITIGLYFLTRSQLKLTEDEFDHKKSLAEQSQEAAMLDRQEEERRTANNIESWSKEISSNKCGSEQKAHLIAQIKESASSLKTRFSNAEDISKDLEIIVAMSNAFADNEYERGFVPAKRKTLNATAARMLRNVSRKQKEQLNVVVARGAPTDGVATI